jgi:ssDNA-specific exonuclease RecJ
MSNIADILDKYNSKSASDIISNPHLARDIAAMNKQAESPEDKERLKAFLLMVEKQIDQDIKDTKAVMADHPGKMNTIQKNLEACLAYIKAR